MVLRDPELTSYHYEVRCNACRTTIKRGNRLESTTQMLLHMHQRHELEDWYNMMQAHIIQMIWNSPQIKENNGRSIMEIEEVMSFMGLMAKDGDIPYEDYMRFRTQESGE